MELEERLQAAIIKAEVAEKLASKAIDMAMDAMIKVESMKQSTHKLELVPMNSLIPEAPPAEGLDEVIKEVAPQGISPFNISKRVGVTKSVDDLKETDAIWDDSVG